MKTPLPSVPVHDGSVFTWAKWLNGSKRGTFTGRAMVEVSTLGRQRPWTQLWDDAADVGFQVRSPKTGKVRTFALAKIARSEVNEVTHWEFASYDDIDNPLFITVFND